MRKKKDPYYDTNSPPWARYNCENYISTFSGTAKQKRESDKMVELLLSGRLGRKRKTRRSHRSTTRHSGRFRRR